MIRPSAPGYWTRAPKYPSSSDTDSKEPNTSSIPKGSACVVSKSRVWGKVFSSAKNFTTPSLTIVLDLALYIMIIASEAAVGSSSSDALAISMPVNSMTMVWKLRRASSLPCDISAWYGV